MILSISGNFLQWRKLPPQCLKAMKLTAFLLTVAFLQVHAKSLSQITLSLREAPIEKVFNEIERQTGYGFLYTKEMLAGLPHVTIKVRNATVGEVLNECFKGQLLEYSIDNNTVVITRKLSVTKNSIPAFVPLIPPPPIEINGRVVNQQGEPLQNVSVLIAGTKTGTTTDSDGRFTLTAPDNKNITLEISSVGYQTKRVSVGKQTEINVVLETDISGLSDVVVVGYGTQKKTSLTAAVSTLQGKDIASTPIPDLSNGLGGRMSGVIFNQTSGKPGDDGSNIYIRGISTTGSTQPLFVVDGIPRNFQQLDPNTIESVTVLKDAAAVAPYGVAGANGVILITTKKGKMGAPSLTYNNYVGFQNPTIVPSFVNSFQFATLRNAAAKNEGLPIPYNDEILQKFKDGSDPDAYPDPDIYRDLATHNSVITSHNLELSGGTDKIKYYTSLGYLYQAGLWPSTNKNRYNLTINLDAQPTKTTKISFNVDGRVQKDKDPAIETGRIFELIAYARPDLGPIYYSNGLPGTYATGSILSSGYQRVNTTAIYSQLSIQQDLPFIPGLFVKGTIAYDPIFSMDKHWTVPVHLASIDRSQQPYVIKDGIFGQTKSSLSQSLDESYQLTYQASLNYGQSFGKSDIGALVVFEARDNNIISLEESRMNYNLNIDEIDMGSSSQADMTTNGTSSVARQLGLVYRVTYNYDNRYLFEASVRNDGNYYFAPGKRFGTFPAVSLGWRLSNENFIKKNLPWINNLKLRGSYGEVGALAGSPFQYLSSYYVYGPAYVIGGSAVQGMKERPEPNPNITWEKAKKTDVGLEATLWNGLLSIEADYFYEKRSNMLVSPDVIVSAEYGIGISQVNAGVMENRGIDFSVHSSYNVSGDLQLSLGGNFTYAKNKLLQVFETPTTFNNPNRRLTGRPLNSQFGYKDLGFFQPGDFDVNGDLNKNIAIQPWGKVVPGDIRYADLNNDGKINDDDLTQIGDAPIPQIIYGIMPHIRYKGFMLDVLFQGAAHSNHLMTSSDAMAFFNGRNAYVDNLDYWTPENPQAKNPRITGAPTTNNKQNSSFWIRSTNYLRLKSATFSYSMPSSIIEKISIQSARIYLSGQNLITWTKLTNWDPETISQAFKHYPQQKVISIGLNLTFN